MRKVMQRVRNKLLGVRGEQAHQPVNFRDRESTAEALQQDVDYAVKIADEYLDYMSRFGLSPEGKFCLEIGPGINFGTMLTLAAYGATVGVSDLYLVHWQDSYHLPFYKRLRSQLIEQRPNLRFDALDRVIETKGYEGSVYLFNDPAKSLSMVDDWSIDFSFSNAVLEHIWDLQGTLLELFRVTKPGGFGFHQVDFRDHRDFSRPLEYLTLPANEFQVMFDERHGECGSQVRPWEAEGMFIENGFEVLKFRPNWFATDEYLSDFVPRLAASASEYRGLTEDQLRIISGHFTVFKHPRTALSKNKTALV